jgi:CDI immunity proteins
MLSNIENKSISQLTGVDYGKSNAPNSYLVDRCIQLCNTPISQFEVEDYRILINQGIALEYLVPIAMDILSQNIFAEGDYFEGDLLKSILTIEESFWNKNHLLREQLRQICLREFDAIENLNLSDSIKENLYILERAFLAFSAAVDKLPPL